MAPSKKSASKSAKNDESEKEEQDLEEERGELVSKMARLDVRDVAYLAKWVKLIRKALELQDCDFVWKPAFHSSAAQLDLGS